MIWGIFAAKAISPISFLDSNPKTGETISSFENIVLQFDLSPVVEALGEGEWGIGYEAFYDSDYWWSSCAYLFKGENEDGEQLAVLTSSLNGTDSQFKIGNEMILSFPGIEVVPGENYTIVIKYLIYATKKGSTGQYAPLDLLDNPIELHYIGAASTSKNLGVSEFQINSTDLVTSVSFNFNYNIAKTNSIDVIEIYENANLVSSSTDIDISENKLVATFNPTPLYNGHTYSLRIPAGMVSIADDTSIINSEQTFAFEGSGYNMFGYDRILPRPGTTSLLEEIQVSFDFPQGYGFVNVSDDTHYPISVYKGEVAETNLLGTVNDDNVTSDSRGLIYHPDFDWEAGETYTFVLEEDVVKAYEIGAMRPIYLQDHKCERIEFVGKTPSIEDIPVVEFTAQTEIPEMEKLENGLRIAINTYEFNDIEYDVYNTSSTRAPLYEVSSNGAERKIGDYFLSARNSKTDGKYLLLQVVSEEVPIDFALDNDKQYRFDIPENFVIANQKLLKKYSGNKAFSYYIKGASATSFDITYQITDGGSMTTTVAKGSTPTFKVVAPQDWKVESVKFNGEEVELVNDEYTTPAIEADATVEVEYAYAEEIQFLDLVSSIEDIDVDGSNYSVGKDGEYVVVNNVAKGDVITVYTVGGMQVANHIANNDIVRIQLPAGIYIIRVNNVTFKIQH